MINLPMENKKDEGNDPVDDKKGILPKPRPPKPPKPESGE